MEVFEVSIWTHVAGLIRIDSFPPLERGMFTKSESKQIIEKIKNILKTNIPRGSEGSVHYQIARVLHPYSILFANVIIWGDLRDFDENNLPEIERWLEQLKKLDEGETMIRQAVVEVDIEFGNRYVYSFVNGEWRKKKVAREEI